MTSAVADAKLAAVEEVDVDGSGRFKYILIKCTLAGKSKYIVRGYKWADYHADIYDDERTGINALGIETECVGGGRIDHNKEKKMILVYGYSMGFGRADHSITVKLLQKKYSDYTKISFTNEGY